jgi:acyl carrier protein
MERAAVQTLLRLLEETLELDADVTEDTPLLSSGLIDSFDLVVLVGALEDAYGVRIDLMDVDVDELDTPSQILRRVRGAMVSRE